MTKWAVPTPTLHLSFLDGVVIACFIVFILGLGLSTKLRDSSILQYLAAGRSLSMPAFVATLVSTWYGGVLAVGDGVKSYGIGGILLFGVPYYVFAIVYAQFYARRVRGAEQISIPERLATRWGKSAGLAGALLIFMLAVPAAHVLMIGTLVQVSTGWSLGVSTLVGAFIGTLFLYKGGLLADVRVGMVAFLMMYVGFFVIVGWCLTHHPVGAMVKSIDPALLKIDGGQGFVAILTFFIIGSWTLVDPGFHQRVSSAASPEVSRKGLFVCVLFWMLFDLLSTVTGLYAIALLKPAPSGLAFFPLLGDQVLPAGLKAIFLCGLAGAVLSAMVGYTLVSGATFGREFIGRLRPDLDEHAVKLWTRVGFALACVLAIVIDRQVTNVVVDLWYAYSGAVVGALLLPVSAVYLPKFRLRASAKWATGAMGAAFITSLACLIYSRRTQDPTIWVSLAGQRFGLDISAIGTLIPGLIVSAIILCLGEAVGRRASTQ